MDTTMQLSRGEHMEHGQTLLFVNSASQRSMIAGWLDAEGFATVECHTLAQLKDDLSGSEPDVLIVGSNPSDMDASRLTTWIRSKSGLPVIAIVEDGSIDIVELLEAGADIVILEPLSRFEFVARVRAVLRRTPARTGSNDQVIVFDELVLDLSTQCLRMPAGSVYLEGRELTLMETLMRSGSRVCSRRHLQSVLALPGKELDYLIRRLRQRIEVVEGWRRIVSRHGLGFHLLNKEQPLQEGAGSEFSRVSAIESPELEIRPMSVQ